MHVKLIMPPSPYLENDLSYPPMGLLYLGTMIENMGHSVGVLELGGNIDWKDRVKAATADIFGVQMVTPNFRICKEIVHILKINNPDKPVLLGGPHPSFLPSECLMNTECDAVVTGEGELSIQKIIGEVVDGGLRQKTYVGGLVPVQKIPKPARHLVDLSRYSPGGVKSTPVYSSRGCPYNCAFCSRITGRVYREIPISQVVDEITEVVQNYGFDHIVLGDDNISVNQARIREISRAVKHLDIGFRLNVDTRVLSRETCQIAAESGCSEISFGIESGSDRILSLMNKGTTAKENVEFVKTIQSEGILAKAYFIVNFPGETESSVRETLQWAEEARPDKWLLSAFAPLPGSPTFISPRQFGIHWMSSNWEDYYLMGEGGSFVPCFKSEELDFDQQIYLHDLMREGLINILGKC